MSDHYLEVRHGHTVDVVVAVNDFVLHRGTTTTQDGITMPIDRFLVPGNNELQVTIIGGDPKNSAGYFRCSVRRFSDHEAYVEYDWEKHRAAEPEAPYPLRMTLSFGLPADREAPVWFTAPSEIVPMDGNAELFEPIRELEAALAAGNVDAVVAALALRASEAHRMENIDEAGPQMVRASIAASVTAPFVIDPAREGDVVFRSVAGGRAVAVTRRSGLPAIFATNTQNERIKYAVNLFLVRHEGRYQIFS